MADLVQAFLCGRQFCSRHSQISSYAWHVADLVFCARVRPFLFISSIMFSRARYDVFDLCFCVGRPFFTDSFHCAVQLQAAYAAY